MPLEWAKVQGNLAVLELAFFDKSANPARPDAAEAYMGAAREVFIEAEAGFYIEWADNALAGIDEWRR